MSWPFSLIRQQGYQENSNVVHSKVIVPAAFNDSVCSSADKHFNRESWTAFCKGNNINNRALKKSCPEVGQQVDFLPGQLTFKAYIYLPNLLTKSLTTAVRWEGSGPWQATTVKLAHHSKFENESYITNTCIHGRGFVR